MMPISHEDLGVDEDLGRRVLARARVIAPCISSFVEGTEEYLDTVAILRGVIDELPSKGTARVRGQRIGSAGVDYADIKSAFDGDPSVSLRALCAAASGGGGPRGSFPTDRPLARLWPEQYS